MAGFKQIKIFTDTNIVHAAQAHLLISTSVHKYVSEHREIESVELNWYLPGMVLEERRHQMLSAALSLRPKLGELEKLLDHSLAITPEVMSDRINSKINKTIEELGIKVCDLDTSSADWSDIIERSVKRKPPFEISNEKEKGFRDAVIASTFLQEIEFSPKTPRACLLVFISGDKRVKEYLEEKTASFGNVRLLDTLDELKSLLNAIASEVTEEFLKELLPKAEKAFYDFDKKDGLFQKDSIGIKISEQFQNELNSVYSEYPTGSYRLENGITLGEQTFIKKVGQTVTWSRAVSLGFKVSLYNLEDFNKSRLDPENPPKPATLASGQSNFSVIWQHQVSTKGNVVKPKINEILFIENVFDIAF